MTSSALDDFASAARVLVAGNKVYPGETSIRAALSTIYLQQANELRVEGRAALTEQLLMLQRALLADPKNLAVLVRIAEISDVREHGSARELFNSVLTEGRAAALVHVVLGLLHAKQGANDLAELHFQQATRLQSLIPVALSNLSWLLASAEDPALERALLLSNTAVKLQPSQAAFRATRGQVFLKLGRWNDAIADLQIAVNVVDDGRHVHEALAIAYDQLGDQQRADYHRTQALGTQ